MTASALRPSGSTRSWRRLRAWVLARDGYTCQRVIDLDGTRCGAPASHAGHVIGRADWPRDAAGQLLPGIDAPGNLRAECPRCNLGAAAARTTAGARQLGASRSW